MTASVVDNIGLLAERLREEATDADVEFTAYPSGSAMLDVRRRGRLYVMAFSPQGGFGVDEVRDGEGLHNADQFVFNDFQRAADKLWELTTTNPVSASATAGTAELTLIVVYAQDIAASKQFYETLGLAFRREQHGGPEHYAAQIGDIVFEVYPRQVPGCDPAPLRIGFRVPSVDQTIESLSKLGARLVKPAADTPWGRRAVVKDPDGYIVEIFAQQRA